jgi:hypothetical protein
MKDVGLTETPVNGVNAQTTTHHTFTTLNPKLTPTLLPLLSFDSNKSIDPINSHRKSRTVFSIAYNISTSTLLRIETLSLTNGP